MQQERKRLLFKFMVKLRIHAHSNANESTLMSAVSVSKLQEITAMKYSLFNKLALKGKNNHG